MRRAAKGASAGCLILATWVCATSARPSEPTFDEIFSAYTKGDFEIIRRSVSTDTQYNLLRKDLDGAIPLWKNARQHAQAAFMIDLAAVGLERGWRYWLDVLKEGRKFVMSRSDPPGQNLEEDAFEIAWHKTAVAILENLRQPQYLDDVLHVTLSKRDDPPPLPLADRMAAEAPATGEARLIDPWIDLTLGIGEEEWTQAEPHARNAAQVHGPSAIAFFDSAAKHESTRAEALVRKAWMLMQLGQPADALTTLDDLGDGISDATIRYWRRLFRARALQQLDRRDEARTAFEDALLLAPHVQSPTVALAALAAVEGRHDDAFRLSAEARNAPPDANDPFWLYPFADHRFLDARLEALRHWDTR